MSDYELAHEYETVNVWRTGGAVKIELNRPDVMNAWNRQFGEDLLAAVEAAAGDDDVRAEAAQHRHGPRCDLPVARTATPLVAGSP